MRRKVVAYIRVSTEEQASHGYSIPAQEQTVREFAAGHNLEIVEEFVEAESASKPGRPEFDRMAKILSTDTSIRAMLCARIDRVARNMTDYVRLTEALDVDIISATEQLPENSLGHLMGNMQAAFSTYFSQQLSERVGLGMETKAKTGLYPSYAPIGYLNDPDGRGIVPDPTRADLVCRLFETYARTDVTVDELVKWASEHGLTTRRGGPLRKTSIHALLRNPIYCGVVRWKGKLYDGKHEPLVSRQLFDRVQDRLHGRGHKTTKRTFAYRGLVTCGDCGCQVTASLAKGTYAYYRCTGARGGCKPQYIREDRLGEMLASVVAGVQMTADDVTELLHALHVRRSQQEEEKQARIRRLDVRREAITHRREAAYVDKLDGKLSEERWVDMDRKWAREEFQVKCELDAIGETSGPQLDDVKATLELLKRAPDLYLRQSDAERARLLRVLVWNCRLSDGKIEPIYRKPFDLVAKGLHSANWYASMNLNSEGVRGE